jgi:hypothetical protein
MSDAARARSDAGAKTTPELSAAQARVGSTMRGKWHLDALLGVGGMAAVYAATHRTNGRRVALKILHAEFARDGAIRDRFLREGYVGNKVPHRGRVEVLDDDTTDDGCPVLVMELLEGETLDQVWKRLGRRIPVVATLNFAEQLLDFLSACHAQGIVHRDLKPANVFITQERAVKVLDFGVAQLREGGAEGVENTRAGTTLGTPAYMAPEQARGLGDKLDGRADLFSVGAMLYALLSGKRLHAGRSNDEALILAATQPAPSLARVAPELPAPVIALVDKSLAWDRRQRFADAAEMRAAVVAILEKLGAKRAAPEPYELDVEDLSGEAVDDESGELAAESVDDVAPEDDPVVERLRGVFRQIERMIPAIRQYGVDHPEAERRAHAAFEELVAALAEHPTSIHWTVRPYSLAHRGREVWEPSAPLDVIPYALFEAGVRVVRVRPSLREEELRRLVAVWMLDPSTDLAPEDDLSTVLWELDLPHVEIECADGFAEGGAAAREAFFEEAEALEKLAAKAARAGMEARAEARAMAVTTDRDSLGATPTLTGALGLDATTKLALRAQLELTSDRWSERYVDVLVEALLETRRAGDVELVVTPLAQSVADWVVARRPELAQSMHTALLSALEARLGGRDLRASAAKTAGDELARLGAALTHAMFGAHVPLLLSAYATAASSTRAEAAGERASLASLIALGLHRAGPESLGAVVGSLGAVVDPAVAEPIATYLARAAVGRERELVGKLAGQPIEVTRAVLAVLAQMSSPTAREAIAQLSHADDPVLRLEALLLRANGGGALAAELTRLLDEPSVEVRLAALAAAASRNVRELAPLVHKRIEEPTFHALGLDERAAMLSTLQAIDAAAGERCCIELLGQRQMIKSESREQSRALAAEQLGAHARSAEALEAVSAAAKGWWGSSGEMKRIAENAARAIDERRQSAGRPGGRR